MTNQAEAILKDALRADEIPAHVAGVVDAAEETVARVTGQPLGNVDTPLSVESLVLIALGVALEQAHHGRVQPPSADGDREPDKGATVD